MDTMSSMPRVRSSAIMASILEEDQISAEPVKVVDGYEVGLLKEDEQ